MRSHFTVLSYSPETSESRPCHTDSDSDGLNLILFLFLVPCELSRVQVQLGVDHALDVSGVKMVVSSYFSADPKQSIQDVNGGSSNAVSRLAKHTSRSTAVQGCSISVPPTTYLYTMLNRHSVHF